MDFHENAEHFLHDIRYRTKVMLYLSFALNLFYALIKLTLGIWGNTVWDVVLALYYMALALMRFVVLRTARNTEFGAFIDGEYRIYRFVGAVLFFLNLLLSVMVAAYLRREVSYNYSLTRLIIMAAYSFWKIISATVAVVRSPRQHSPLYSSAKNISLAAALVSMLSLEEAMLESFSTDPAFRDTMVGVTGFVASLILIALSIYMITRATLFLRRRKG